jgi:Polysaccharide lyase
MHRAALAALLALLVLGIAGDSAARHAATGALFTGDFETGSYTPWPKPQCSNYGYSLGVGGAIANFGPFYADTAGRTHNADTVPAGQGAYFGEFSVPADTQHKQRCQLAYQRSVNNGGDDYYSLMVYVPAGWSPGNVAWGPVVAQLNYQAWSGGKALALTVRPDHVTITMQVGKVNATPPLYTLSSDADNPSTCRGSIPCSIYAIPPGHLKQGAWNEIILHDHWTTTPSGVVEAWYRQKGAVNWTQSVHLTGVPTLQYDATHSGVSETTLETLGNYRAPSSVPETVYLDGFTRAASFAAAAAELP